MDLDLVHLAFQILAFASLSLCIYLLDWSVNTVRCLFVLGEQGVLDECGPLMVWLRVNPLWLCAHDKINETWCNTLLS